jgi:uncharacterized protein involved in cysteine biosynthesis
MSHASPATRIGFRHGFAAIFSGARCLMRLPGTWPYALVPALSFALLEAGFVGAAWQLFKPGAIARASTAAALSAYAGTAAWLEFGVTALAGWLLAALLAPTLSSPALERIVTLVERDLGVPERAPLGFFAEFWCGVRSLLLSSALTLPALIGLSLLELVAPPLAVVATPLKLLLGALGVAWGLFDYPLTLRGVGARQRFAFMRRHASVVLGFGAAFSLAFWLPCCGILLLPVGVAAATTLCWRLERAAAELGRLPAIQPR